MTDVTATVPGSLYVGRVSHRRHRPRAHALRYRIFSILVDIDRIDDVAATTRLFSRNRFNLYSFHDRDHGDGSTTPLRAQIDRLLTLAGVDLQGGRILLLCMPRVLGYVFNPLSVYYCHDAGERLAALVYEVNNTFGQRHTYVIPVAPDAAGAAGDAPPEPIEQRCTKRFHVSPFLSLDMRYTFRLTRPSDTLSLVIDASDLKDATPMLNAAYGARRLAFDDAHLIRLFVSHPLLTLKVIVGIHWEALQVWRKGARYRPCPPLGAPLTIVHVDGHALEPLTSTKASTTASTPSPTQVS